MNNFFRITIVLFSVLGALFVGFIVMLIYFMTQIDNKYTGQDLFNAINGHRQSVGVQIIELDENLCDNLVERWLAVKNPDNGHAGFEEWGEKEGLIEGGIAKNYGLLSEIFIGATTPDNAITGWVGSPSHRLVLENPNLNVGCAYAAEGVGIAMMGSR